MNKVAFFLSFLLFAYFGTTSASASTCPKLSQYTTKLQPECHEKDQRIWWPNYEDQTYYIQCVAPGKAEKVKCKEDEVFVYVLQLCKPCEKYLPPIACSKLPTTNPPKCVPIENNGNGDTTTKTPTTKPTVESTKQPTYSTPRYPTAAPSTATTEDINTPTVLPPAVTEESNTTKVTENITKPTENPTNTDFPGPPSPPSTNPDVPQPETPLPTPPVVNATPPSAGK